MIYKQLDVWVKSKDLAVDVYRYSSKFKDYGFKDQITRSALSIPSSIADKIAGANFECRS